MVLLRYFDYRRISSRSAGEHLKIVVSISTFYEEIHANALLFLQPITFQNALKLLNLLSYGMVNIVTTSKLAVIDENNENILLFYSF